MDRSDKTTALEISREQKEKLIEQAFRALPRAYAPYSHFHVAAALLCRDGEIYMAATWRTPPIRLASAQSAARFCGSQQRKRQLTPLHCRGRTEDAGLLRACGICRRYAGIVRPDEF